MTGVITASGLLTSVCCHNLNPAFHLLKFLGIEKKMYTNNITEKFYLPIKFDNIYRHKNNYTGIYSVNVQNISVLNESKVHPCIFI